ncbi:MAG TPA: glycoside hydrolase domain-containing protein [Longimicrobium sp.]|nr:glycoside hydrolase domain-containing protein [Longimicrobium sp.]
MLAGTPQAAPAGVKGFDANTVITESQADAFWSAGYRFALRYVGRTEMKSNDLTADEASMLLSRGFALMTVQHVKNEGWMPTGDLGTEYGANAAAFTRQIGFPGGVNLWMDLEGVSTSAAAPDVIAYCNNWYTQVANAGYVPGIYVGWEPGLTGSQLYSKLRFQHYWAAYNVDGASRPDPRGWQLMQSSGSGKVGSLDTDVYDVDHTYVDKLGGQVLWLKV